MLYVLVALEFQSFLPHAPHFVTNQDIFRGFSSLLHNEKHSPAEGYHQGQT